MSIEVDLDERELGLILDGLFAIIAHPTTTKEDWHDASVYRWSRLISPNRFSFEAIPVPNPEFRGLRCRRGPRNVGDDETTTFRGV